MEEFHLKLQPFRDINSKISRFINSLKLQTNADIKFLRNDEFTFLGGKFKFVRTLSLAKEIGMVDVFYWREDKGSFEMIEKFNIYFYADGPSKITNYIAIPGELEKGVLRTVNENLLPDIFLKHFYEMLMDKEIAFNLSSED